ncbi:hypothetical protein DFO58_0866 [Arthrobacter sp. AG1021]|nr:hypothetical protein DFO58_0866 [Arthrobacter sp. AG1021]
MLSLGQRVEWMLAYATRGGQPYYMRDSHEQFSYHGAKTRRVLGSVVAIRELVIHPSRADGTPVHRLWRSLSALPAGVDYDSDGIEVDLQIEHGQQLPELFSWPRG